MIDLKLNGDHDLAVEDNNFVLVSDLEELTQRIKSQLQFFWKEWFLDTTKGLNWDGEILGKGRNINLIDNIFKIQIVEENTEVEELTKYNSSLNNINRTMTVTFTAKTIYGPLALSEVVSL